MPSSYTASARFTLQATGENNNTWGVILNQGVFQLVDDAENGRLAISLSGPHTLTVNLGATDEARMKFIDVTGGSGGVLTAPSVPKAYFVHNGSSGIVGLSAGGATLNFNPGDAGPVHTDGTAFYPVLIGGLTIKAYTDAGDAAQKAYTDAQIAGAIINMPSVTGKAGQVLTNDGTNAFWSVSLAGPLTVTALTATTYNGYVPVKTVSGKLPDANLDVDVPFFRNRIINGDMRIDARHAGAATTPVSGLIYAIDRWRTVFSQSGKVTLGRNYNAAALPVGSGFVNYLGAIITAAFTVGAGDYFEINQPIEGLNISDLLFGTANAKPVTLSFWAQSNVTGTFSGALQNGTANRSYPFTFALPAANTWTKIVLTIPGDTAGTWAIDNTSGLAVVFSLGVGSTFAGPAGAWAAVNYGGATGAVNLVATLNGTFYLTGVQLEVGSLVSTFERRPNDLEKQFCRRYFQSFDYSIAQSGNGVLMPAFTFGIGQGILATLYFLASMRVAPTCASTFTTARFIGNVGGGTFPIAGISGKIDGPLLLFLTNTTNAAAFGWADTAGILTADAEL
jgi:hypothetical protein